MFPSFISILDIQSWWEVPSIAHFCSLFRAAFNLLDFDIEELEEALLTDGTEDSGSSLLQELIVRLLCGCLGNNDISTFNYQMFLRRLFRQKCQEHGRYNPFNTDIDFQFLPLRTKVEILHTLCDFRLDAEDVLDLLKNLEAESLRVEPLGYDDNNSAYWYFYGTRLYREDYEKTSKKNKTKSKSVWQVVCFTEQDWTHLTAKFKGSSSKSEKALFRSLSENFLPEIPRLFQEKERLQRKRLLELQPRRTSNRVQRLRELREEARVEPETAASLDNATNVNEIVPSKSAREVRALHRSRSSSEINRVPSPAMPIGRQTNNSLASATGQILIQPVASTYNKKLKTSQVFRQTAEDLQTGMYKILEYVKNHDDAWPFIDPVEEDYAPNYYSVIRKPMDLQRMEEKLDAGEYLTYSRFKSDFQLIVDNCRLYNGSDNEYTEMVDNLQEAFEKATFRFLDQISSSDDEISVEFPEGDKDAVEKNKKANGRKSKKHKAISKKKSKFISKEISNSDDSLKPKSQKQIDTGQKTNRSTSPQESDSNLIEKAKQHRKDAAVVNKQTKTTRTNSRNCKKVKSPVVHRSRSRSKSDRESWTSSPSPPPPRIQKKKKVKENVSDVISDDSGTNLKNKKVDKKQKLNSSSLFDDIDSHFNKKRNNKPVEKYDDENIKSVDIKDRNIRLKDTIAKLKQNSANNVKDKDSFTKTFDSKQNSKEKIEKVNKKINKKKITDEIVFEEKPKTKTDKVPRFESEFDTESSHTKDSVFTEKKSANQKKSAKKVSGIKSTVALEALELVTEQTLKDINKWLDDTPKYSEFASASNSPSHIISAEEFDIVSAKVENDFKRNLKLEKSTTLVKSKDRTKEILKRRSNNKDFRKAHRRREVQRSIDRLQPGKSKGNLISNMQSNKNDDNVFSLGLLSKSKDTKNSLLVKTDESGPKLSLGTVLDSFGQQHNFVDDKQEQPVSDEKNEIGSSENQEEVSKANVSPVLDDNSEQVAECKEKESVEDNKQATATKATPNFNAWIKAFGAPKSATAIKKKNDTGPDGETDNKRITETAESSFVADEEPKIKSTPIEDTQRIISPTASLPPESPVGVCQGSSQPAPRTRKASTGSTVSERSSFSQDMTDPLDSPRLSLDERLGLYPAPYPSPMHRSPAAASPVTASPRNDEQQKTSYPPLNGTIRVGFYQDTVKSSPEKSCSPREQPRSPYPQYSSHVYTPSTSTYQYGNPPPYPGPSPSHSPVYTRPHSPVYTQSRSLPSYESAIHNPSYFESERLVTDPNFSNKQSYYFNKMENLSQRGREKVSISSAENRENIGQSRKMVDQPVESHMNNSENANISRDTDRFQNQQSPVFPVKKRLYNDVSNDTELCTNPVNLPQSSTHESSSIQNSQSSSAINVGLYASRGKDPNLPVCHRTSDSRDRTAAGDDLRSSKSFDGVPDVPIAKPVPGNNKPFYPSSSELIDSPYCMSERASNVTVQNLKPPNISKPIKTIDLTGSDPMYDRRSSRHLNVPVDMGLPNNRTQHDRNSKISDSYGHVDMTMMNDTIDMSQVQYSRADNFSRNSTKPSDIQSNHQMHLSVSNSIVPGDSQQMTYSGSRGLPLDVNLHHPSLHLPSTELRIPNQRNELSMLNINDGQKSMTNLEMNIPVSQRNDLIHPTPRNNENQLNLRSEHTAGMNPANSNYKEDVSSMFNTSSSLMMDAALGLRGNLANLSHIVDRYSSDERLLSGLPTANAQFYQDKTLSNQPVYSKGIPSSIHASNAVSSGLPMFSQPGNQLNTTLALGYRSSSLQQPQSSLKPALTSLSQPQSEKKSRKRKTKPQITSPVAHGSDSSVIDSSNNQGFQSYVGLKNNVSTSEPSAISLKTASVVPGSAFNFGPAPSTLNLSGGLYGDKDGYGGYLDDYRNPATNYYMAAAAAAHHGAPPDVSSDETQRTSQPGPSGPFPFLGHPQARPTYSPLTTPFMPTRAPPLVDPASPLYQQYIQRHQEEILRHSGVLHQGLLGTGYALGMRQPFDVINRPSWL